MHKDILVNNTITLDKFLKWAKIVDTGGMAKLLIQNGEVKVNNIMEKRRSIKLNHNDIVTLLGSNYRVIFKEE